MKFLDLQKTIPLLRNGEFKFTQTVYLYAVGGFPIIEHTSISDTNIKFYSLLNLQINEENLKNHIQEGLGLSGMLTYMNSSNLSLNILGQKCKELKHTWGYNWMTLSFLIVDNSGLIEKSFLRHNKFYESWSLHNIPAFGISGSIKDFDKFINNKNDISFDIQTRNIMKKIHSLYSHLWK